MVPATYWLCPYLEETYGDRLRKFVEDNHIHCPEVRSRVPQYAHVPDDARLPFFNPPLKEGGTIDVFGVGHELGSAAAMHMTYMRAPLEHLKSVEELKTFPFASVVDDPAYLAEVLAENEALKAQDKIILGDMQMTVWERAWYLRRMERMMMDMMIAPDQATFILDQITTLAIAEAEFYTKAGCDVLFFGDDVGMQNSILMSLDTYRTWLKPRIIQVIEAAKAINPEIIIFYHSCGFVEPFIDDLIDAGVEVLNPVQPECMDFAEITAKYGDRISFHGTIGTQTTMPKGTPEEVRQQVFRTLELNGEKGGVLACPTHMLEPEVPVENIISLLDKNANKLTMVSPQKEKEAAQHGIEAFRIRTPNAEKMIAELSGGDQQKCIVARWIATNPKVLILDEPTKGIDVGAKSEFYQMICQFAKQGLGVILISSELPEVIGLSDRILVMHNLRIVGEVAREDATEDKILSLALVGEEIK